MNTFYKKATNGYILEKNATKRYNLENNYEDIHDI